MKHMFRKLCLGIPRCVDDDVAEEEAELAWDDHHDEQEQDIQTWTGHECSTFSPENKALDLSRRNHDSVNCPRLSSCLDPA